MKPPRLIAVLPTMLTLANGACGFGAITFAAKLGPTEVTGAGPVEAVQASFIAASLIFLAMLFDMLDGSVARLMKQTSELGAQLDSLCDAVSFGVAPAFLMLQVVSKELVEYGGIPYWPRLLWTIAVLYAMCAILRLARFNVETDEDDSHGQFSGLPSPAAAGAIAAFPFAMPTVVELIAPPNGAILPRAAEWIIPSVREWIIPGIRTALPLITAAVAALMVSRIPYAHFFAQLFSGQRTKRHVIQLVFLIAAIFWVHELAVPLIFCWFAFAAPVRAAWTELVAPRLYRAKQI
ncbi:MAG: CDP-diacylglycerol--serine O-phosphatidyltransferase [Planctomycetota bacterium]|nr:MAG: CDP-diacylglycerol--serine O-phosphatidyltransferase [Planctomycetota bacterium]REK23488.1 MAG: CDP-diacylglycerol--serine O-phosphatidyltransferase [Planctomycetota bacterium]REK38987.1 MAG: CDP-diacylglycerol--serine O-phosphatidyltransferase [Planctomycetota bacterium]